VRRTRPTLLRAAYAGALAISLAALALALREWVLVLPLGVCAALALATPFLEWTRVPESLVRMLPRVHALALFVAGAVAWLSRSMGVLVLAPEAIALVAGPFLVPIWLGFALAPRAFPAGRTLLPGIVALLAFAGLNPMPPWYGRTRLPFLVGGEHNGFAEIYLGLSMAAVVVLWTAELVSSGPRWSRRTLVLVATTGVLAVALAASGVVGLPLAQPHVERAFAATMLDEASTGLSGESTLGDIGALSPSRRRVLDLQTSLPSGGQWLLPAEVFTRFDGRRWTNAPLPGGTRGSGAQPRVLFPKPEPPRDAGALTAGLGEWFSPREEDTSPGLLFENVPLSIEMRVTQAQVADWPLLLPRDPTAVTAQAPNLELDRFSLVRRPRGIPLRQYGALVGGQRGKAYGGRPRPGSERAPLTPEEREEALQLPGQVDPRVVALAERLAPAGADDSDLLDATVRHLQTRYTYSLTPGPFRPAGDPLAEFLFEKKAAYCEYFASAAVVLLRLRGVPARYVKGLSVGPQTDMGGGLHVVRESDAHAWVEAWLPGSGWVAADPTPPGQFAAARGTPSATRAWVEHARAGLTSAWRRLTEGGMLAFLRWLGRETVTLLGRVVREPALWLVVLMLALGPAVLRRLRRRSERRRSVGFEESLRVPADVRAVVRELERRWAALGRPRPVSRGLLEHARVLAEPSPPGTTPVPGSLKDAGDRIVRAYYRARFGQETLRPEEVQSLRDGLDLT